MENITLVASDPDQALVWYNGLRHLTNLAMEHSDNAARQRSLQELYPS